MDRGLQRRAPGRSHGRYGQTATGEARGETLTSLSVSVCVWNCDCECEAVYRSIVDDWAGGDVTRSLVDDARVAVSFLLG